jgi:hypothetical protein
MRVEIEVEKKETDALSQEQKESVPVSIEEKSQPLTLSVYAKDGIGSSGKMHKGG